VSVAFANGMMSELGLLFSIRPFLGFGWPSSSTVDSISGTDLTRPRERKLLGGEARMVGTIEY